MLSLQADNFSGYTTRLEETTILFFMTMKEEDDTRLACYQKSSEPEVHTGQINAQVPE